MGEEVCAGADSSLAITDITPGAANIGADDTPYTDGGIVREGYEGDQGDGAFSTGVSRTSRDRVDPLRGKQRGGAANIGAPGVASGKAADQDIIPETAIRENRHEVFHTGRGGEGNLHHPLSGTEHEKHNHKHEKEKEKEKGTTVVSNGTDNTHAAPSVADTSSSSSPSKTKKRRSLFRSRRNSEEETDPAKKAKLEEKAAKKAEHEKEFPPPTHGGLGDKLKYKLFGRLYD